MSIPNEVCGETYDVVVVGGGPSGATAAHDLALTGRSVLLLDKAGRIKPCGGAIPPRLVRISTFPTTSWSPAQPPPE
jgi:geranylgeranyl reductase